MVLHCWLQRAGCISQVTELIYKFMAKLYSSDFPLFTNTYKPRLTKYFHQLYDALMLMAYYRHLCIFVSDAPSPLLCPGTSLLPRHPCGCCHPHCQSVCNLPPHWPSQGMLTAGLLCWGQLRVVLSVCSEATHLARWWQERRRLHGHLLAYGGQVKGGATSGLASQGTWYRGKSLFLREDFPFALLSPCISLDLHLPTFFFGAHRCLVPWCSWPCPVYSPLHSLPLRLRVSDSINRALSYFSSIAGFKFNLSAL